MAEIAVKIDETCCTQGDRRSSESFQVIQLVDILSDIPRHFVADNPVWITCILLYEYAYGCLYIYQHLIYETDNCLLAPIELLRHPITYLPLENLPWCLLSFTDIPIPTLNPKPKFLPTLLPSHQHIDLE